MTKTNTQTATTARAAKANAKAKPAKTTTKAPAKAKVDPDSIKLSKGVGSGGDKHIITSHGGDSRIFATGLWTGDVRAATGIGQSFKAAVKLIDKAETSKPVLAKGVDGRNSPHTAKSIADRAAKAKATNKADAAQATGKAKADGKSAKAKKQNPVSVAHDRTYKVVNTDHGARPDSKRAKQLNIVFKHTSTAAARAKGAESCDFRYAADKGFIKFA